jgi:hypothetical protein
MNYSDEHGGYETLLAIRRRLFGMHSRSGDRRPETHPAEFELKKLKLDHRTTSNYWLAKDQKQE